MTIKVITSESDIEADIIVGGVRLTEAQSLVFRLAIDAYVCRLSEDDLGEDFVGKFLTQNYARCGREVLALVKKDTDVKYAKAKKARVSIDSLNNIISEIREENHRLTQVIEHGNSYWRDEKPVRTGGVNGGPANVRT